MIFSRTKRLFLGAGFSFFAKGATTIFHLIVTGILNRFLSPEHCGIWLLLTQLVIFVSAFDLGIGGGGLRNALTRLNAKNSAEQPTFKEQHLFLSTVYFSILLYGLFSIIFGYSALHFNWNHLFHIKNELVGSELQLIMSFVIICIFLRVPFSISASGFYAYHETHIKALLEIIELSLLSLVVIICGMLKLDFLHLTITYYSAFFLLTIIGFIYFLKRRSWKLIPLSILNIKKAIYPLFSVNVLFWIQNIASLALFSLNPLLISMTNNAIMAGQFGLLQRLFSVLIGLHFIILNPLWTAYSDAYYKKDWLWIRKSFLRSILFTGALFGIGSLLLIKFYKPIIAFWTSRPFENDPLMIGLASWALLYGCINCLSVFLNSLNLIKNQVIFLLIGALMNTFLGLHFGKVCGPTGIIYSAIISLIPLLVSNTFKVIVIFRKITKAQFAKTQTISTSTHE